MLSVLVLLAGRCVAKIGSLRICLLGVYSFVICWSPLGVFGARVAVLGTTLCFLLGPLGSPWITLGRLGLPWGSPWSA